MRLYHTLLLTFITLSVREFFMCVVQARSRVMTDEYGRNRDKEQNLNIDDVIDR